MNIIDKTRVEMNYQIEHCETIKEVLSLDVKKFSDCTLFEYSGKTMSYRRMVDLVILTQKLLREYAGEYILINLNSSVDFAIAFFAIVLSGKIAVLHDYHMDTLEAPFQNIQFACTIDEKFIQENLHVNSFMDCPERMNTTVEKLLNELDLIEDPSPDDTCTVLCSSGTTSIAKGICLSHRNLCSSAEYLRKKILMPDGVRTVSMLPMNHVFGLIGDLLNSIYTGTAMCILDSPIQFISALSKYHPHRINIPPAVVMKLSTMLMNAEQKEDVVGINLRTIITGGAPIDDKYICRIKNKGISFVVSYGQTECPVISYSPDQYHKAGSVGFIHDKQEIRISENGEILVKGPSVMNGYLNDAVSTKESITDGWLHTGDIGYIDEDNFLYLTGRKNNLAIFSDGTKCTLESVETLIGKLEYVIESIVSQNKDGWDVLLHMKSTEITDEQKKEIKTMVLTKTKHSVKNIFVTAEPLARNKNGKLIREKCINGENKNEHGKAY